MKTKIIVPVLTIIISLITSYCAYAWVEPTTIPPGNNIFAPLNSSSFGQSKLGGLILNLGQAAHGLIVRYGLVGIGTDSPESRLDVRGETRTDSLSVRTTATVGTNLTVNGAINSQDNITTQSSLCIKGDCKAAWPTETDTLQAVTTRGNVTTQTIATPIMYDQNNPAYYVNPDSWTNANGIIANDVRAQIFYDQNNTGYYVNPDSLSNLNVVAVNGQLDVNNPKLNLGTSIGYDGGLSGFGINFQKNSTNRAYGLFRENGAWTSPYPDLVWGAHTGSKIVSHGGYGGTSIYEDHNWSDSTWWHNGGSGTEIARFRHNNYGGTTISTNLGVSGTLSTPQLCLNGNCQTSWPATSTDTLQTVTNRGNTTAQTIATPIMYDQNNPAYYVNPDSWTNANGIIANDVRAQIFYDTNNTGYYLDMNNTSKFNAVDATYYHTVMNDSWFPYPGNGYNYIRGHSFINGVIYDENNSGYYLDPNGTSRMSTVNADSLCLGGECINEVCPPGYFKLWRYEGSRAYYICQNKNAEVGCNYYSYSSFTSAFNTYQYARYINGEKYTRAMFVPDYPQWYGSCDSGYVKGTHAECSAYMPLLRVNTRTWSDWMTADPGGVVGGFRIYYSGSSDADVCSASF